MRVIGTAGHVDHGKSTLIQALTGTHPDRLKEEQEREMTIDLGFGWWTLPDGEEVGVVDVPGHRDFIENMLAGIGGIDAALFVVAADEGVMPQTKEHLAILDILQIPAGVVAMTKIDMVKDPDWLDLVEEELRQEFSGTVLQDAPIVRVSARTGENLEELQSAIQEVLAHQPNRPDLGRPRLPVDRVFSMSGFGTVVTGTLADGHFSVGDEIVVLPGGKKGRIRGLQTHRRKAERATPGSRTAVNITGMNVEEIKRGQVVTLPGILSATRRMDVSFTLLPGSAFPLEHNTVVKFFTGSAEIVARVRLIGSERLMPGERGWLQLELPEPVVAARGDRYILRRPSPTETIGGGVVLDPSPDRRHKRFSTAVMNRLNALEKGNPEEVLMQALTSLGAGPFEAVDRSANLSSDVLQNAADSLLASGKMVVIGGKEKITPKTWVAARPYWEQGLEAIQSLLEAHHEKFPLRLGMPSEELKSRLNYDNRAFSAMVEKLVEEDKIAAQGAILRRAGHTVEFSPEQQAKIDGLLAKFAESPFSPPTIKESIAEIGEDLYQTLVALGLLLPVSSEVVFRHEDFRQAVEDVKKLAEEKGTFTLAEARDHWGTTRRYVQDLLEFLDREGITIRVGEARKLRGS